MTQPAADAITPLLLAYEEQENLSRTLDSLRWARRVVVLDSGSKDGTKSIAAKYDNVDWFERSFDTHAAQWAFGVFETGIDTDFVLALDADMAVTPSVMEEIESDFLPSGHDGGVLPFSYRVLGRSLAGSIYPAQLRLFRRNKVRIFQLGHTQVFEIEGSKYHFRARVDHDDRKPLERWVASQLSYSKLEAARIDAKFPRRLRDQIRRRGLMPPIAGLIAYIRAGGPLRGRAAIRYAYERAIYESLLALRYMGDGDVSA